MPEPEVLFTGDDPLTEVRFEEEEVAKQDPTMYCMHTVRFSNFLSISYTTKPEYQLEKTKIVLLVCTRYVLHTHH